MPLDFKFVDPLDPYDGFKDPLNQVEFFDQTMIFQGAREEMIYRAFRLTLKLAASYWFSPIPSNQSTVKDFQR
jgi:hypothetical protein